MLCPACDHQLQKIETTKIAFDICKNGCGGILINKQDLKNICLEIEGAGVGFINIKLSENERSYTDQVRICPKCSGRKMVQHFMNGIEIEECYKCGGIWLDIGELESICEKKQKKTKINYNAVDVASGTIGVEGIKLLLEEIRKARKNIEKNKGFHSQIFKKTKHKTKKVYVEDQIEKPSIKILKKIFQSFFPPLTPQYNEITLFLMSLACILIYSTESWFNGTIFLFAPGIAISVFHVFSHQRISEWEKGFMLFFACFVNFVSGVAAGIFVFTNFQYGLFLIFAICNIINCLLLPLKFIEGFIINDFISEEDAPLLEVAIGSIVIILTFIICQYIFKMYWAITFSICVTYASNVNKNVMRFINSQKLNV